MIPAAKDIAKTTASTQNQVSISSSHLAEETVLRDPNLEIDESMEPRGIPHHLATKKVRILPGSGKVMVTVDGELYLDPEGCKNSSGVKTSPWKIFLKCMLSHDIIVEMKDK